MRNARLRDLWVLTLLSGVIAMMSAGVAKVSADEPSPAKKEAAPAAAEGDKKPCSDCAKSKLLGQMLICPLFCWLEAVDEDGTTLHYHYSIVYNDCEFSYIGLLILDEEKFALDCNSENCEGIFAVAKKAGQPSAEADSQRIGKMNTKKLKKPIAKDKFSVKKGVGGADIAKQVGEFLVKVRLDKAGRYANILVRMYVVDPTVANPASNQFPEFVIAAVESRKDANDTVMDGAKVIEEGDNYVKFSIGNMTITSPIVSHKP